MRSVYKPQIQQEIKTKTEKQSNDFILIKDFFILMKRYNKTEQEIRFIIFNAIKNADKRFIYNKNGDFNEKCNPEMVDLDPLSNEDSELLQAKIEKHFQFTKSEVAEHILENWETESQHFVKVMPRDYKKALAKKAEQKTKVEELAAA